MKRVILMHGKDTDITKKWYPWFSKALKDLGIEIEAPVLPEPSSPVLTEWVKKLDTLGPDEETVLVGHSRGGVAILCWLEKLSADRRVKKVILIATNVGKIANHLNTDKSNLGFYTEEGYDFNKIKKHCDEFVVMHSLDDLWVPFSAGEENAKGLDAEFVVFKNRKHFGENIQNFPELLAQI